MATVHAYIYCVTNEFNPTFEVQNMGNEAFQNASFGNASFPNEALGYSCLWAICSYTLLFSVELSTYALRPLCLQNKVGAEVESRSCLHGSSQRTLSGEVCPRRKDSKGHSLTLVQIN